MASHAWAEHDLVAYFVRRLHYPTQSKGIIVSNVLNFEGQIALGIEGSCHLYGGTVATW